MAEVQPSLYWSEDLNSEVGKSECPVPMSTSPSRQTSLKYHTEKLSIEHSTSSLEKWEPLVVL